MRKLLENESQDEYRKQLFSKVALIFFIIILFFTTRIHDKSYFKFAFYLEFIFLFITLRFYSKSHRNKNYAFWGVSAILGLYVLKNLLNVLFVVDSIFILYIALLSALFLIINAYVMSSPLYYPRIQWWEYDFRYRGELKATISIDDLVYKCRMVDLRRGALSFLAFEKIDLLKHVKIEIPYGSKIYILNGIIKTMREDIPGRPVRYGLKIKQNLPIDKIQYNEIKKIWNMHKEANIRRKFSDYKEANGISKN